MSENVQKFRVFLRLPRYPMLVDGTMIDFMVDSRGARSTIRPCDLPCEPGMTDLVFESTSASGHIISENYTVPLKCETEGGRALKHAFLCSETCPVPLMARDLMCKLNLKLTAGPFGIYWRETADELCKIWATVGIRVADKGFWLGTNDFEIEHDPQYEEEWFNGAENEKMFLTRFNKILWNENVCALSACLSEKQMQLYLITEDSEPRLSVTKATEQKWAVCEKRHESHRRAEKGRGEKHIDDWFETHWCRWFIDLCTRWGYVRGWHCNSLEPSGERGSQGQSDKATVCEAGNNFFWITL